ncbi:hypothetical protein ACJX0J_027702, partial [Zea mays]
PNKQTHTNVLHGPSDQGGHGIQDLDIKKLTLTWEVFFNIPFISLYKYVIDYIFMLQRLHPIDDPMFPLSAGILFSISEQNLERIVGGPHMGLIAPHTRAQNSFGISSKTTG